MQLTSWGQMLLAIIVSNKIWALFRYYIEAYVKYSMLGFK